MGVHRALPADRQVRPAPEGLRQQFEGVLWRFGTGGRWREMPAEFGAWPAVSANRFRQRRDAGVFEALPDGVTAEAAQRGAADLSLTRVDSTTARAHHDAAGMPRDRDVMPALERAAAEEENARQRKGGSPGERLRPLPGTPKASRTVVLEALAGTGPMGGRFRSTTMVQWAPVPVLTSRPTVHIRGQDASLV